MQNHLFFQIQFSQFKKKSLCTTHQKKIVKRVDGVFTTLKKETIYIHVSHQW